MVTRVVLATGNRGKVTEMSALLAGLDWQVLPQTELGLVPPPETGLTFVENALLKARHAARETGLPALADDSGIEVDALNGAPGIRSARFAGADASDRDNIELLLSRLAGVPEERRGARFQCLVVYLRHAEDPTPLICQGSWPGRILSAPRGAGGFGYDPVFYDPQRGQTAAELAPAVKNAVSHRGRALAQLKAALSGS